MIQVASWTMSLQRYRPKFLQIKLLELELLGPSARGIRRDMQEQMNLGSTVTPSRLAKQRLRLVTVGLLKAKMHSHGVMHSDRTFISRSNPSPSWHDHPVSYSASCWGGTKLTSSPSKVGVIVGLTCVRRWDIMAAMLHLSGARNT
jgi:hypothetical protein